MENVKTKAPLDISVMQAMIEAGTRDIKFDRINLTVHNHDYAEAIKIAETQYASNNGGSGKLPVFVYGDMTGSIDVGAFTILFTKTENVLRVESE